jgi:hypothetical protein
MDDGVKEAPLDPFEQIGLKKEKIHGINTYTLDFTDKSPSVDTLNQLRDVVKDKRVAVELGPGNQLDSLFFAAKKSNADIVIGVDPNFNYTEFRNPERHPGDKNPTVILFKGDGWGDQRINNFFGLLDEKKDNRLAMYSQLVAPDTMDTVRMIESALHLSKDAFMIVLDSGAVKDCGESFYPPNETHSILLSQAGVEDHSRLSWIKYRLRFAKQTTISKEDYEKGIQEGKYPPSAFLRAGNMMVFEIGEGK